MINPYIVYRSNGSIQYISYFVEHGDCLYFYREDGPAFTIYNINGNLEREEWLINDIAHRVYGPAVIEYNINDGDVDEIKWIYNGKTYTNEANKWIIQNNFKSYEEMTENDFNRMWMEIL